ncbi:MAG: S9 family peptidase [Acidobacteria bacterium]|nr:MAG: S9 family peptidase [Acidobacteriota bacterium]
MTRSRAFIRPALVSCLAAVLALVSCGPAGTPHEPKRYTIEQFLETVGLSGLSFSPDGSRVLVTSDWSGIPNAWAIPVDGGEPVALTASATDSRFALDWFPRDERILVAGDQGGNELTHVFVRETDGTLVDLTPGDRLRAVYHGFTRDEGAFVVGTNERDPRFFDLWLYDVRDYRRTPLYEDREGLQFADISPDRRLLAFTRPDTRVNSDVVIHDVTTGTSRTLTPHEGDIVHRAETFSPDGSELLVLTDEDDEFLKLVAIDVATGARRVLVDEDWDVTGARFSPSGHFLAVSINADARTVLRLFSWDGFREVPLPRLAEPASIEALEISRADDRIAFYAHSARMPGDLFVADLPDGEPRRLVRTLSPSIDPDDLVEGRVVRFASWDGTQIPGILYVPHQARTDRKVPALVWVHGGPGGQSRIGYRGLIQYLVNHGYAIYAINNRGSSGYGRSFQLADDGRHGRDDLKDCIASKKLLADTGVIDAGRIGIIGGSYGGYMVLAALAFAPDEFAVGVDIFGVANWERTLASIPPWWESMKRSFAREFGTLDDADYLRSISPLFHAEAIRRPLFVLQGANDPRVLKIESDEIVAAVRRNGVPVEYLVLEDEGHGIRKKANRFRAYRAILEFLDRHLAAAGRETDPTG